MFEWMKRLVTSRYVKSFSRYAITALATMLAGSQVPGLAELAVFVKANAGELSDILGIVLMGLVGYWSVRKNLHNKDVDEESR